VRLLAELHLLAREVPFETVARDAKRSRYWLCDPFLSYWYRFVGPQVSLLQARRFDLFAEQHAAAWPVYLGQHWERLARESVATMSIEGVDWLHAGRWWGPGLDRRPLELDIIARDAHDPSHLLVGEAKLRASSREVPRILAGLADKARRCPLTAGTRVSCALWLLEPPSGSRHRGVVSGEQVVYGG
jgi:hypothetical protein